MRTLSLTFLLVFSSIFVSAQELNCSVQVILGQNVQTAAIDRSVFSSLESTVREFMNNRKWTKDAFEIEERIECNLAITINEAPSSDRFVASIQVISRRPVYNSAYFTTLMNFNDQNFNISFLRNTRLEFSIDQHRNNLTSVLAYYAYMIIGYDYDSFSLEGGTTYFNKAQQVVTNAQNAVESGWKANESVNNRYWLVENVLHQAYKPLRKAFYEYHRLGLDAMQANVTNGRNIVTRSINYINQVVKSRPGSVNIQAFFRAKSVELVNLYSQAFPQEKNKVVTIFKKADPINSAQYDKILKSN